jgi:SAM-dependent methyltransferase
MPNLYKLKDRKFMKKSITTICPLCKSTDIKITILPYPSFRHMDFSTFHRGSNRIAQCLSCSIVFRCDDEEKEKMITSIYKSHEYEKHEEPHTLVVDDYNEPVPASFIQAKLISSLLSDKSSAVLDIGCFDGMLLSEISKIANVSDLCGFDVAERPQFPTGANFRFISDNLESIHGKFDLIIFSHSIQYIQNIQLLFDRIRALLKANGKLFIQVPNFSLKPANLLFGDLYYHYTPDILGNILQTMGFKFEFLNNNYFPRDILAIATLTDIKDKKNISDKSFDICVSRLSEINKQLTQFTNTSSCFMGVLGTTIDAAFVDNCLGTCISFFVDENPRKVGTSFHGKPILHPNQLTNKHHTILPYGESGLMIKKRFKSLYQGSFIVV